MTKEKTTKKKLFDVLIILIAVLLLGTIITLSIINFFGLNVNCQEVIDKSQQLIDKKQHKQAYDNLKPNQKICGKDITKNSKEQEKVLRLQFHRHAAVSAYMLGKKAEAKAEAEKGINVSRQLKDDNQKSKMDKYVFDMMFVKEGLY